MLQKMEQKQFQDLSQKAQFNKDQLEKRCEQERQILERTAEAELDTLLRQQRQALDKAEAQQESDLRLASKKIRAEQERELKQFREGLKQDLRLLKQEVDLMPKVRFLTNAHIFSFAELFALFIIKIFRRYRKNARMHSRREKKHWKPSTKSVKNFSSKS